MDSRTWFLRCGGPHPAGSAGHAATAAEHHRQRVLDGRSGRPAGERYYSASKFALEGFTEALWQEIEPLGLRALIVQPGSFRTGIEHRTKGSGAPISSARSSTRARSSLSAPTSPAAPARPSSDTCVGGGCRSKCHSAE
jgi:NAD(P)-dependent dehydrogenase (short-subunit alcohol dehydrogenase family)